MDRPRKVNEIFHSLQGEGRHTGVSAVFVRFSGCNLRCPFCDTDHHDGTDMNDSEIIDSVCQYPARLVILTGGEPGLQIDASLIDALHKAGKYVAVETNGTCLIPENTDWVTVSPKTGIGGLDAAYAGRGDAVKCLRADEIKVVDLGQDLEPYFHLPCRTERTLMYLQPCYVADAKECAERLRATVERVKSDPRWTLSLQTHRLIDIP